MYIYIYTHIVHYLSLSLYIYIYVYIICAVTSHGFLSNSCTGVTSISTTYSTLHTITSMLKCSAARVDSNVVSNKTSKCRLSKWLLDHTMNNGWASRPRPRRGYFVGAGDDVPLPHGTYFAVLRKIISRSRCEDLPAKVGLREIER